jgi:hypothetical protein
MDNINQNVSVNYLLLFNYMIFEWTKMTSAETMYLIQHSGEIENEFAGKYIAIFQDKVIACGKTIHEVYETTDRMGVKDPLITYVPRAGEELLLV